MEESVEKWNIERLKFEGYHVIKGRIN